MNGLQIFQDEKFGTIRTVDEDGKILFCGTDVAKALGYKNPRDAVSRHCKGVVFHDTLTAGGNQEMLFITEGDLYRLITHSKLSAAEAFEKWVFDTLLPEIRQTGRYEPQEEAIPIEPQRAIPEPIRKRRARQNWFGFMLSVLEKELGLSKDDILRKVYRSMDFDGISIDDMKARYIEKTGDLGCSTFEAVSNDYIGAMELADILHRNMKIAYIKRCL